MPAAKKPASKAKSTAKAATKKPVVKKAPAKSRSATSVKRVAKKAPAVRSFRKAPRNEPFLSFRVSNQTFYWVVLAVVIVALAAWVLSISIKVQNIYDQIDATNTTTSTFTEHKVKVQ